MDRNFNMSLVRLDSGQYVLKWIYYFMNTMPHHQAICKPLFALQKSFYCLSFNYRYVYIWNFRVQKAQI
jgi:hypothetical protein